MMRALTIKHITKNVLGYSLFIFIVFEYSIIHHNYAFGSQKRVASGLADAAFNSGVLPDNFVSIHIKDAGNKTTSHHVGGIMIHPGVILTAWGTAWGVGYSLDEKYRPIKVKRGYTVYSENELEIVFNLKQGGNKADKKIHFEVKKIINHTSYFDHEPIFHTIALLFFEPNESIAHISSLPLVTTKDFKSYEDLIDTDVWAVGIPHKVQADDQPLVFEKIISSLHVLLKLIGK